jgi:hypothetical protein
VILAWAVTFAMGISMRWTLASTGERGSSTCRRFNRARVDAQRTVDALGMHLRDEVVLDAVHARLLGSVHAAVQPATAAVWIRPEQAA